MFGNGGVDQSIFDNSVVFEDPTSCKKGVKELKEAFRVLEKLQPETLDWNLKSVSLNNGEAAGGVVEIRLLQHYQLGPKSISLRSNVVVQHDGQGRIVSMQDLWNGVPLLPMAPFTWSRRVNGLLSFRLTPFL